MKALRRAQSVLQNEFPEARIYRRLVLLRHSQWFLRGVDLSPSTYGTDYVIVTPLIMALFVRLPAVNYLLNRPLRSPPELRWPRPGIESDAALAQHAQLQVLPWLDQHSSPRSIADAVAKFKPRLPLALEVAHSAMLLEGDTGAASRILDQLALAAQDPDQSPSARQELERAISLHSLAEVSIESAIRSMEEVRSELLARLRLPLDVARDPASRMDCRSRSGSQRPP